MLYAHMLLKIGTIGIYGNLFFVCFDLFTYEQTKITVGLDSTVNG